VPVGSNGTSGASKLNASAVISTTARDGIAGDKGRYETRRKCRQRRLAPEGFHIDARPGGRDVESAIRCQPLQQRLEKLTDEEGSRVL